MKKSILFLLLLIFIIFHISNCVKPVDTPAQLTVTPAVTFTPTCTNTLTGNVIMLDNFNDGDLINDYGNEWSPYWPYAGQWASTPVVTTDSYSGYALKVTGNVTANAGMPPGPYFGTTTYIDNSSNETDIRPINY